MFLQDTGMRFFYGKKLLLVTRENQKNFRSFHHRNTKCREIIRGRQKLGKGKSPRLLNFNFLRIYFNLVIISELQRPHTSHYWIFL